MADHEDEDLQMAIRMSMQHSPPEPKRSKPRDAVSGVVSGSPEESPEAKTRRLQRELMAAAAEKRMIAAKSASSSPIAKSGKSGEVRKKQDSRSGGPNLSEELSLEETNQLFLVVFGSEVSKGILAQWSNQGIRFSSDPETSMGLVQHEGGPCGVLAAIQVMPPFLSGAYKLVHAVCNPES